MITLITPTKPENKAELENCIRTVSSYAQTAFEWLFVTEREHVAEIEEFVDEYTTRDFQVISMASLQDEIEDVKEGYNRQRLAKLYAHREAANERLLFLDDDTEANAPWKPADFFSPDGAPIIYFNRTKSHVWRFGTAEAFATDRTDKQFQIALPFAYTTKLSKMLANSRPIQRAWRSYKDGPSAISDFELMGQFAFNSAIGQFRNITKMPSHWTANQKTFTDWQGQRKQLRAKLGTQVA